MAERRVHFILHVPKCAGTTVEAHFERHLGAGFLRAPRWEHPLRNVIGNRYPYAPGDARLAGVRVVSGHSLSVSLKSRFPGAEIAESVLLRDPLGYFLSFYNYRWARFREGLEPRPPGFGLWYAAQRRNPISRFMLNRYFEQGIPALYRLSSAARLDWLEARLARFHFVGGVARADELIAGVSRDLALPENVARENVTRTPELAREAVPERLAARIAADNALDAALFARWSDRGWRGAPESAAGGQARLDHLRYLAGDALSGVAKKLIR